MLHTAHDDDNTPLDVRTINRTIRAVLRPCEGTPATQTLRAWANLLASHARLLAPLAADRATKLYDDALQAGLHRLGAECVLLKLSHGCPLHNPPAAYTWCQELARQCRALLNLATTQPKTSPGHSTELGDLTPS
ncbi:hypothetical protein ACH4U6_37220 [Streptomyces netropsis]|uniref:hypothetical protein n=1 Tax=Streptomyces netropsis TaxID=55404 RepID=UPI0037A0A941